MINLGAISRNKKSHTLIGDEVSHTHFFRLPPVTLHRLFFMFISNTA